MKKHNNLNFITVAPYTVWSTLFILIPLLIVIFFSITVKDSNGYSFSFSNFQNLFEPQYFMVFRRSISLAIFSTIACLMLGYPVAYFISKMNSRKRNILIMLFIVPMWMNFLLRTYAWLPILGKNGFINNFLHNFSIGPLSILYNDFAVLLGMIYNFLPFMVLPIYTILIKMDKDIINAAYDLGAPKSKVFTKVILPLSIPGILSGITMVFMPAVSTFVISRLLGGGQYMLLGNLIEQQYTTIGDWNFGSAISVFMMIIILVSMSFMNKFEKSDGKEGGRQLW